MSTSAITWAFPLQHQPNRPSYSSAEKRFWHFASSLDLLINSYQWMKTLLFDGYAAYLARSVKYSSIKSYLAIVCHLHLRNGYDLDLTKYPRLQLICRDIKRSQSCSTRVRLPITIHHLNLFFLPFCHTTYLYDSLVIWAAKILAFFGIIRLGELTCNSTNSFIPGFLKTGLAINLSHRLVI